MKYKNLHDPVYDFSLMAQNVAAIEYSRLENESLVENEIVWV